MQFVASLDTKEPWQHLITQHLDKEQAGYGWPMWIVGVVRHQYHNAIMEDGKFTAVITVQMLV